jgi:hypothetical protein
MINGYGLVTMKYSSGVPELMVWLKAPLVGK